MAERQYPLKTLLGLRRREEEAAERTWAKALSARRDAEAEAEVCTTAVRRAAERLVAAAAEVSPEGRSRSASEVAAAARFLARLRAEMARTAARRDAHERGALATARAAEAHAQADLLEKRRSREALETHEARFAVEERRESERRADDENDEHARVARRGRGTAPDAEG